MRPFRKTGLIAILGAAAMAAPFAAAAHRSWLLPSATVLSGQGNWVTVDAARSNDLFYFDHMPFRIDGFPPIRVRRGAAAATDDTPSPMPGGPPLMVLDVTGPTGDAVPVENKGTGRYRATFDVELATPGTYRIAAVNEGMTATWKENGQPRRWRGTMATFDKDVPKNAPDLRVSQNLARVETFVTSGKPTRDALKPTGRGLELDPVTHPNDLVAGEPATFRLVMNGAPAPNAKITVIPGGIRYRNNLQQMTLETDAQGAFTVLWPAPGMYWFTAAVEDRSPAIAVTYQPRRRASYAATVEVMAP